MIFPLVISLFWLSIIVSGISPCHIFMSHEFLACTSLMKNNTKKLCNLILPLVHGYRYLPMDPVDNPRFATEVKRSPNPYIHEVPFLVLVFYPNLYCSGSIISSKSVLTAASCLPKREIQVSVKTGTTSIADEGEIISVVETIKHEFYKYRSELDNDIALLVLEHSVTFSSKVQKIILQEPDVAIRDGSSIVAAGWGCTVSTPSRARQLTWSSMFVLDTEECYAIFGSLFTTSMFCAKYELPDRRLSDNGGPAIFHDGRLVGVASFAATNAEDPMIAIFTNVSYFYRWIKVNTQRFLHKYCLKVIDENNDYQYYS